MSMKLEYRVRPVTRYIVTKHRTREDGSGCVDECAEVNSLKGANLIAEGLAAAQDERIETSVIPLNEPPGRTMRCKAVLTQKRPNVALVHVYRVEDAPGRYTEEPWSSERHGKIDSGVTIKLDPTDPLNYRQDGVDLAFAAVWGGQDPADGKNACHENRIFADATPSLNFTATVRNASVTDRLEVGQEYYVDFIPAPKS